MINYITGKRIKLFLFVTSLALGMLIACPCAFAKKKQKELKLIMATNIPPSLKHIYKGQKTFVNMVNERGKGVVQINMYWSGSLLKGKQLLPGLQAGTVDMIWLSSAYVASTSPILGLHALPLWKSIEDSYEDLKIGSDLARLQNEELKKKNLMQVLTGGVLPEYVYTRKRQIKTVKDMKGLKLRVVGKVDAKIVQALGGFPVSIPAGEHSQALQRGVVDGSLVTPWATEGRGLAEHCKYLLIYPIANVNVSMFVLRSRWDPLPENVKKVLMDCAIESERLFVGPAGAASNDAQLNDDLLPLCKKKGMTATYLSKENALEFDKAVQTVVDWWIKKVGAETGNKALGYVKNR